MNSERTFIQLLHEFYFPKFPHPNERTDAERKENGKWMNRYCHKFINRWQFLMLVCFIVPFLSGGIPAINFLANILFLISAFHSIFFIIVGIKLRSEFGPPDDKRP